MDDSVIRIVLSWDANPRDLDSHLTSGGMHIYYANKVGNGVQLDKDDVTGYGPETITLNTEKVSEGIYSYYVYRYAGTGTIASSGAVVRVYKGDTLIKTYSADQTNCTDRWDVFKVDVATGEIMEY